MNWEEACQTLGVPVSATQDEMRKQYLYKAQILHPDKTMALPDQARQKAEEELKVINAAYAVLKDTKNNAAATPPKLRVNPRNIRFADVGPGQQKTTRIQIESIGGPYTKFWMSDSPAPWLKIVEVKSTTNDPLPLEVTIEASGSGTSKKRWQCNLPVRIDNEKNKTRDEITINIEMQESRDRPDHDSSIAKTPVTGRFALSNRSKVLALALIPLAAGLIIYPFLKSFIPFWILLAFAAIFLTEKWLKDPTPKHKPVGIVYRIILNIGILSYIGFLVWSGIKLFSRQFMPTALTGSLVFLGEFAFFVWLWIIIGKNSWRWPSMKLTIAALIVAFLVFSYAGVQPMAGYKDAGISHLSSFFGNSSSQGTQPTLAPKN